MHFNNQGWFSVGICKYKPGYKNQMTWYKFEICQSTIYYAWLLGRWDKRIVDQESDVPSIISFILFIDLGHSKLFIFIFVIFLENKKINGKYFCKEFCKKS